MAVEATAVSLGRPYSAVELKAISDQLGIAYRNGERRILELLAEGNLTDWRRAFLTQQLAQIRGVLGELDDYTGRWAAYHMPTLYEQGMSIADDKLLPGGLSKAAYPGRYTPMDLGQARLHQEAVRLLTENVTERLAQANAHCGQRINDMVARAQVISKLRGTTQAEEMVAQGYIREASLRTVQEGFVLGETTTATSKTFLEALRQRGITSFVDKSGRAWNMATYADMVARTVVQEAQRHGTQNRLREAGQALVQISEHAGACPICIPWEGVVLRLDGSSEGAQPTIDDAMTAGLFHPNCGHAVLPYFTREGLAQASTNAAPTDVELQRAQVLAGQV